MDEIERLAKKAEAAPGRKPEAIRARLAEQIAALLETSDRFDPDRLNQEAIMIATKADIREELDRIASHVAQAREMIGKGRRRSAGGSISSPRNSTARSTPAARNRTTWN